MCTASVSDPQWAIGDTFIVAHACWQQPIHTKTHTLKPSTLWPTTVGIPTDEMRMTF